MLSSYGICVFERQGPPKTQLDSDYTALSSNETDLGGGLKEISFDNTSSTFIDGKIADFKIGYGVSGDVKAKFYKITAGNEVTLPNDSDQCAIVANVSKISQGAITFVDSSGSDHATTYEMGLLNTQWSHKIPSSDSDKIIFKMSIFAEDYPTVRDKIGFIV